MGHFVTIGGAYPTPRSVISVISIPDPTTNLSKNENVWKISVANTVNKLGPKHPGRLTPLQVANMRSGLFRRVEKQIGQAHAVVMGTKEWTPTQARVFATMLNKVVPDLTAAFVQHEHNIQDAPEKMSRQQLEAIAFGVNDIIDASPISTDADEDDNEDGDDE
jgi:hypothetical protein